MALLFESNGDWPDTDEDYRNLYEEEEDPCFFCSSTTNCICDEVYDFAKEQEYIDELDSMDD